MEPLETCRSGRHTLCSVPAFEALLVDEITLDLDMCSLGV